MYSNKLKKRVSNIVKTVRQKFGIDSFLTIEDFERICQAEEILHLEYETLTKDMPERLIHFLTKISPGFFKYKSNDYGKAVFIGKDRHIFIAAHELGHYFLGHIAPNYFNLNAASQAHQIKELEADYFAELMTGSNRAICLKEIKKDKTEAIQ